MPRHLTELLDKWVGLRTSQRTEGQNGLFDHRVGSRKWCTGKSKLPWENPIGIGACLYPCSQPILHSLGTESLPTGKVCWQVFGVLRESERSSSLLSHGKGLTWLPSPGPKTWGGKCPITTFSWYPLRGDSASLLSLLGCHGSCALDRISLASYMVSELYMTRML